MKRLIVKRLLYVIGAVSLIALIGVIQPAMAQLEGPSESPPTGVYIVDSDPGDIDNKEQWGREAGRTFEFTIYNASAYDQLIWQPSHVAIAFDGIIEPPGETLSYSHDDGGTAVWTGATRVLVLAADGSSYDWEQPVYTEFRLTVTDIDNNLVAYTYTPELQVEFDLTSLTPNEDGEVYFSAKLEMRAQMPSYGSVTPLCSTYYGDPEPIAGEIYPALNVFDCLQTHPSYDGLALTEFEAGFLYELASLDLSDHDTHIAGLIDALQSTTDEIWNFTEVLFHEVPGRLEEVWGRQFTMIDYILNVDGDVSSGFSAVTGTLGGIESDVDNMSTKINDISDRTAFVTNMQTLLLMFGVDYEELGLPNPGLPDFGFVEESSQLYAKLNSIATAVDEIPAEPVDLTPVLEALATMDFSALEAFMQTNADDIQAAVADTYGIATNIDNVVGQTLTAVGGVASQATDIGAAVSDTFFRVGDTYDAVGAVGTAVATEAESIRTAVVANAADTQAAVGAVGDEVAAEAGLTRNAVQNSAATTQTAVVDLENAIDARLAALEGAVNTLQVAKLDIQLKDFESEEVKGKETVTTKRFIVLLTENGDPVDGTITSIAAIVDGEFPSMVTIGDFTDTRIGEGIYELTVPLADPLGGVKVLFIRAEHTASPTIFGSKLFTVGLHTE